MAFRCQNGMIIRGLHASEGNLPFVIQVLVMKFPSLADLDNFVSLKRHDLCDTHISLESLVNLARLYLSAIPISLGYLVNLKHLDLRGTRISQLPKCIGNLINLEFLDLRGTCIKHIPTAISTLRKLEEIWSSESLSLSQLKEIGVLASNLIAVGGVEIIQNLREIVNPHHVAIDVLDDHDHLDRAQASAYWGWIFVLTNLALETLSAILDQISSPSRPRYALIAMLVAFAGLLIGTVELVHNEFIIRRRTGFHNGRRNIMDNFGVICAMVQCIASVVQYVYVRRHEDNPVKLCYFPLVFALYVLYLKVARRST